MILAHGVGSRADLPLPVWLFAYSASFALLISFAALRLLWPSARLRAAAPGRRLGATVDRIGRWATGILRVAVSCVAAVVLIALLVGRDSVADNIGPTAFYIAFWVGMQVVVAVTGDLWRGANPLWLLAAALDRIRQRDPAASTASGGWASHWPAAGGLLAFQWLELAFHRPASVHAVATYVVLYLTAMLLGASRFGAGWIRTADGFAVLFGLLGALAPITRDDAGHWRMRPPFSGLTQLDVRAGTVAVVLVVLGGTSFDGVSRTQWWTDLLGSRRGWDRTTVATGGLLLSIAVVSAVYVGATQLVGRLARDVDGDQAARWVPSLVPIVLAYSVAHYFSLLVFEGQSLLALASDPFGRGWDLFGTAANRIDYLVVSANQIAYVQVAAIVVGHVAGVVVAHDLAVERYDHRIAVRSQYPLLAAMVAYTTGGLLLLLNA